MISTRISAAFILGLFPFLGNLTELCSQPGSRILGYFPEDFFMATAMGYPQISPDGSMVLYFATRQGRQRMFIYNVQDQQSTPIFSPRTAHQQFTAGEWVGNQRIAYQLDFGDWHAINAGGTGNTRIFRNSRILMGYGFLLYGNFGEASMFSPLIDDPDHVLISSRGRHGHMEIFKVNTQTGEYNVKQRGVNTIHYWVQSPGGAIMGGVRYRRNEVEFRYRAEGTRRWRTMDHFVSGSGQRFSYSGASRASRRYQFLSFGFGEGDIYYASNVETDTNAIYRMNLQTGKSERLAWDPDYDLITGIMPGEIPVFSRRNKMLVGVHYHRDKPASKWILPEYEKIQHRVDELIPDRINQVLGFDDAESRFVIRSTDSRDKGRFYLYLNDVDELLFIGEADPRLDRNQMAKMEPLAIPMDDGRKISAYLTMPREDRSEGMVPLVVLIHGGPWVRDVYGFDPEVQFLAYHGYAVLQVNYRGSAGFGYDYLDAIRRQFDSIAVRDIENAIDWTLVNFERLHSERVALMGASYGAYASLNLLLSRPERYRAGVIMMGVYDVEEQFEHLHQNKSAQIAADYWAEMVAESWDKNTLRAISPIHRVAGLEAPVYIIHGEEDWVVPVEQSQKLEKALADLGKEHQSLYLKGEGHGFQSMPNVISVYSQVLRFLNQNVNHAN